MKKINIDVSMRSFIHSYDAEVRTDFLPINELSKKDIKKIKYIVGNVLQMYKENYEISHRCEWLYNAENIDVFLMHSMPGEINLFLKISHGLCIRNTEIHTREIDVVLRFSILDTSVALFEYTGT